jgi:hypothetical protein
MQNAVFSFVIKTNNPQIDFVSAEGIHWLSENLFSDDVEITRGKKELTENRNESLFEIIKQGGIISKGELFTKLDSLINQ